MALVDDVIANATAKLGAHYLLGTEGPTTFDCSGLMWWIFDQEGAGAKIGGSRRRAAGYTRWFADAGQFTRDFRDAQRGDLIVYEHPVGHIGIYLGGGDVISALIEPYHVSRHKYNRISVPFYGVLMVDYSGGGHPPTTPDDAPDTTGAEDDVLFPADDIAAVDIERAHGRALWHIEFEDRPRRASGKGTPDVVNKVTRRRPPPPEQPPEATVEDDAALTLDVWQLQQDNITFTATKAPYGTTDATDHTFAYAHKTGGANVLVGSAIEGEVLWPWANCGGLMPAWIGETRYELWGELDLSGGVDPDWLGLRIEGTGADWGVDANHGGIPGGTPIADRMLYYVGWGTPDPTGPAQFQPVAEVNLFEDFSVFIPRNLLTAGMNALVLAPTWVAGGYFCQQDLNDPGPGQHRPAVDGSGLAAACFIAANNVPAVYPVLLSGSGRTPWVPADGDIDGSNATFTLLGWDGTGAPDARVDDVILAPADYTFDAGAFTVTLRQPPATGAEVAFRYNSES
jgi:hypothetical protein